MKGKLCALESAGSGFKSQLCYFFAVHPWAVTSPIYASVFSSIKGYTSLGCSSPASRTLSSVMVSEGYPLPISLVCRANTGKFHTFSLPKPL